MPTGYTQCLYDGKEIGFPEFAMKCARAFGALVEMRDDPFDAEIPGYFPPSEYAYKRYFRAQVELAVARATTMEQAVILAAQERAGEEAAQAEYEAEIVGRKAAYEDMLEQVRAWDPPTEDHRELKKFMIDQITGSIDFDCRDPRPLPPAPTPEEWISSRIERLRKEVERSQASWKEDLERSASRSEWVRALRSSLAAVGETRRFHIGDIITVITGRLVSPRHVEGLYDILNWMTDDNLFTHQLPRASRECTPSLRRQCPDIAAIDVPDDLGGEGPVYAWLAEQVAQYGETRRIAKLGSGIHEQVNPIEELLGMVPAEKVSVVVV